MARAELAMDNVPPSQIVIASSSNADPGVVTGELPTKNPQWVRSVVDHEGIGFAVRIWGSVLELSGRVKERPIRVLIDSGATGNFISDELVIALRLRVVPEAHFAELTLADGSIVKAAGTVQFKLCYGNYKGEITARVFPNLSKELILGMPWIVKETPSIDWTAGRVKVQKEETVLTLPP